MTLKSGIDEFYNLLHKHIDKAQKATLRWVTCTEIDWEDGVMTAVDVDNVPYHEIMLGTKSKLTKPIIGSDCLIGIVEGHETMTFLIEASEVELVEYNEGKNGGLTNSPELKEQLEKMSNRIDGIMDALKKSKVVAQDGGAAYKTNITIALGLIVDKESFDKIEDKTITH